MYKLIIVDDESWIRERLRYTINWKEAQIDCIYEAGDGEEALEIADRLKPDIIITDIRMPGIDGLDLIKKLKENNNTIKIIVISGYSYFDYAQKALKYGATDYILKPVEEEDLINSVKKCINEIESEGRKETLLINASQQAKDRFLINLISNSYKDDKEIKNEMEHVQINISGDRNICFVIEVGEYNDINNDNKWNNDVLLFAINNIIHEFIDKISIANTFSIKQDEITCLSFSKLKENDFIDKILFNIKEIKSTVKKITGYDLTIGVGRIFNKLIGAYTSYEEAKEALMYKTYFGRYKVYDIRDIYIKNKPNYYKPNDTEILINNIKLGNKEDAMKIVDNMIRNIYSENENIQPIDLKLIYIGIINPIIKIMQEVNATEDDSINFSFEFIKHIDKLETADEIENCIKEEIIKVIDVLNKYKSSKKRRIIEKALDYMNEHYNEQITLSNISDRLYLNESYFCKIFKKETGQSFTKYLMNIRIEKAKELLKDPTLKIYQVSELVGYEDVQYFTKIFKNFVGVSAMKYRENIN